MQDPGSYYWDTLCRILQLLYYCLSRIFNQRGDPWYWGQNICAILFEQGEILVPFENWLTTLLKLKKTHILHFWTSHFIHIQPKISLNCPSEAFWGQNSHAKISHYQHCVRSWLIWKSWSCRHHCFYHSASALSWVEMELINIGWTELAWFGLKLD